MKLTVEIYNVPGGVGVVIGELAAGTPGVIAHSEPDNWCNISRWVGQGPVHWGYVFSGPEYRSLEF